MYFLQDITISWGDESVRNEVVTEIERMVGNWAIINPRQFAPGQWAGLERCPVNLVDNMGKMRIVIVDYVDFNNRRIRIKEFNEVL